MEAFFKVVVWIRRREELLDLESLKEFAWAFTICFIGLLMGTFYYGFAQLHWWSFIEDWQSLFGALVGAAAPLGILLYTRRTLDRRDYLIKSYKRVIGAVRNILEVDSHFDDFRNIRIQKLLVDLEQRISDGGASGPALIFFPPVPRMTIDDSILEREGGSGYVETLLLGAGSASKSFALLIDDAQKKFESMLKTHDAMFYGKLTSHVNLHKDLQQKMKTYQEYLGEFFYPSLHIYVQQMVKTRVIVRSFIIRGRILWRFRFEPSFKYFLSLKKMHLYIDTNHRKIDYYYKNDVEKETDQFFSYLKKQPDHENIIDHVNRALQVTDAPEQKEK